MNPTVGETVNVKITRHTPDFTYGDMVDYNIKDCIFSKDDNASSIAVDTVISATIVIIFNEYYMVSN